MPRMVMKMEAGFQPVIEGLDFATSSPQELLRERSLKKGFSGFAAQSVALSFSFFLPAAFGNAVGAAIMLT